jgi:hypothetical protein
MAWRRCHIAGKDGMGWADTRGGPEGGHAGLRGKSGKDALGVVQEDEDSRLPRGRQRRETAVMASRCKGGIGRGGAWSRSGKGMGL